MGEGIRAFASKSTCASPGNPAIVELQRRNNEVRSISVPILGSSQGSVCVSAQGPYSEKLFTISSFRDLETRFTFLVLATLPGRQAQQLGPERLAPLPCPSSLVTQHDELHQLGDE